METIVNGLCIQFVQAHVGISHETEPVHVITPCRNIQGEIVHILVLM